MTESFTNHQPVAQIIALNELSNADRSSEAKIVETLNPLHQIKARLSVCVGEAVMTVGEILNARENQVVRLDRQVEQAVDLILEGRVVARGQLVAVDDHFAVRITELPIPLKA
ncbi:MAG: FliM/FliN family flagellar motor switch protein [Collimonas sp.]|uniref:FliM/FliN family flagellar motor switch protein n=1 Tax=Collimonas sp. TaxID=1963772 RepID=UPI00326521C8